MESVGVLTIALDSVFILLRHLILLVSRKLTAYNGLRHDLGKIILLGLEILVTADIIATVSTEPTVNSVLFLAVIVLVRTFLSFSLQVELVVNCPGKRKKNQRKLYDNNVATAPLLLRIGNL